MNFENIAKILANFITYGIPVLSFLWQIKTDSSDKKQIESIVTNYNNRNQSSFDFKDVSVQNGYIQINNPQNINIELKGELDKFEDERLEDKKFLSNNLYKVSSFIILIVFILNLINGVGSDFKNISLIWDNLNIIKNNVILSFDATLKQLLLMIVIYIILVIFKYLLDKKRAANVFGFILALLLYLFTYWEIKNGFIQFFKYPIILSDWSVVIPLFVALIILTFLFFSLITLVERLFNLISKYNSKIKTKLFNTLYSLSIVIAPIIILIVKMVLK